MKILEIGEIMKNSITTEEFKNKMQEFEDIYAKDIQAKHIFMDGLLSQTLIELGYGDGVKIFLDADKHYI